MTTVSFPLLLFSSQDPSRVPEQRRTRPGNDLWPSFSLLLLYFTVEGEDYPGPRFLDQGTAGDCLTKLLHLIYRSTSSIRDPSTPCHQIRGHQRYANKVTIRVNKAVYLNYTGEGCREVRGYCKLALEWGQKLVGCNNANANLSVLLLPSHSSWPSRTLGRSVSRTNCQTRPEKSVVPFEARPAALLPTQEGWPLLSLAGTTVFPSPCRRIWPSRGQAGESEKGPSARA